jgi:hypothetical protein
MPEPTNCLDGEVTTTRSSHYDRVVWNASCSQTHGGEVSPSQRTRYWIISFPIWLRQFHVLYESEARSAPRRDSCVVSLGEDQVPCNKGSLLDY